MKIWTFPLPICFLSVTVILNNSYKITFVAWFLTQASPPEPSPVFVQAVADLL
jgi:hypothetical protein